MLPKAKVTQLSPGLPGSTVPHIAVLHTICELYLLAVCCSMYDETGIAVLSVELIVIFSHTNRNEYIIRQIRST